MNTAAAGQDPQTTNNTDDAVVAVVISTDLGVVLNAPATAAVGARFAVNATVANAGPSDLAAGEATVAITLPSGISVSGPLPRL